MRKKIEVAVLATMAICCLALLAKPAMVRYIEKAYPEVSINGDIRVYWGYVTITQVRVSRPSLKLNLSSITVNWSHEIHISGGNGEIELISGRNGLKTPSKLKVTASRLNLIVRKGVHHIELKRANVDLEKVCFQQGYYRQFTITSGCILRDASTAVAESVKFDLGNPISGPLPPIFSITIRGGAIDLRKEIAGFNSVDLGDYLTLRAGKVSKDRIASIEEAVIRHPLFSTHPVTLRDVEVRIPNSWGEQPIDIRLGETRLVANLSRQSIAGEAGCSNWVEAIPRPSPKAISQLSGNFKGALRFEASLKPIPRINLKNTCAYDCKEEPVASLVRKFSYEVYDRMGRITVRESGPGSLDWVSLTEIPPRVPRAFVILEDPAFDRHRGIIPLALENSLKDNIKLGRFFRGGSTITMQLAKNLWLRRDKTVIRKGHEAFLALALESCLTKAQIMELYLNVVEYGPDLYGIGPASRHYFSKHPNALSVDEAFYLASLLPNPKRAIPPNQGGLEATHKLMGTLAQNGLISEYLVPQEVTPVTWQVQE